MLLDINRNRMTRGFRDSLKKKKKGTRGSLRKWLFGTWCCQRSSFDWNVTLRMRERAWRSDSGSVAHSRRYHSRLSSHTSLWPVGVAYLIMPRHTGTRTRAMQSAPAIQACLCLRPLPATDKSFTVAVQQPLVLKPTLRTLHERPSNGSLGATDMPTRPCHVVWQHWNRLGLRPRPRCSRRPRPRPEMGPNKKVPGPAWRRCNSVLVPPAY